MTKPQRFKILRNADPEALAREISEHLSGVEHTENGKTITYVYALHGETRYMPAIPSNSRSMGRAQSYEQNVCIATFFEHLDRVEVEAAASEAIQ